jgi:hypothetical protein
MNQSSASNSGYLSSTDWSTFNNKISASEKGVANGVANLDANGKIATSMIPAISFSTGVVVNSQTEMLGLSSAVTGTIAIRTDNNNNYVLSATPASVLTNWIQLAMPTSVQTINGITGVNINLTTNNITEGSNNKYYSNTLSRNALSVISPLVYDATTGVFSITASGNSSSGYLTSSDWNTFNNKLGAFGAQIQNQVYASPDGTTGSPSFRSLVANDIPVLNQNTTGTAANITATINNSLQSLTALNTIGTINTGIWHGSNISPQYGGTGINNGSKTISLGGNLTTANTLTFVGNYTSTLTMTGNTSVILPTTGTLVTLAGTETLTNKTLTSPVLTTPNIGAATAISVTSGTINSTSDITAKRFVLTNNSISSSTSTNLDLSSGNVITINMTSNINTLNLNNPSVGTYLIKFVQDAIGSRTITFPSAWKWAGGITPLLTTTANKLDIVTLIYDGTNFYATIVQNF